MTQPGNFQVSRRPLLVALVLAILMVVGVLVGAKLVYSTAAHQPVAMTALDSPDADSAQCEEFIAALPNKVLGHKRAELADPAPAGAAAWSSSSTQRVTLRCGVSLPLQYTELSTLRDAAGADWLQIIDATPGSTMQTWYSINTHPVVAVTVDADSLGRKDNPVAELSNAVSTLEKEQSQPYPVPLADLAAPEVDHEQCVSLNRVLPDQLGDYTRTNTDIPGVTAWVQQGYEPIVVRCGVADPENYHAGAALNQVDEIPWFEDTKLANGTTAGTYFALGREVTVALSMPSTAGNTAITTISQAIAANTTRTAN